MKIHSIPNCEISLISDSIPHVYSQKNKDISYEWFYIEINKNDLHLICILACKDSFNINELNPQSSIYFTLFKGSKLISYSYSYYENENSQNFIEKMSNWIAGKEKRLDLWFPDHSLKKYLNLVLENRHFERSKTNDVDLPHTGHYWQFINAGEDMHASISIFDISEEFKISSFCSRENKFFDYPLAAKLKMRNSGIFDFKNANFYFDHNFGFAPIYTIKDEWYWGHFNSIGKNFVFYFFPKLSNMFYLTQENSNTLSSIVEVQEKDLVKKFKYSIFGIKYPNKIKFDYNTELNFNEVIESAPFYQRMKSHENYRNTLEVLRPLRIPNKLNQVLIQARKIKIIKNISNYQEIEFYRSFSEICNKITWNHGKSFYFASLVLSYEQRNSSYFVYTLCRLIDDATDEPDLMNITAGEGSLFSITILDYLWNDKQEISDDFIRKFVIHLSARVSSIVNYESAIDFILNARILIKDLSLDKSYFTELISGQEMDENFVQPININELYLYCFRVAGVVGLMMAKIFKTTSHSVAMDAAEKLGCAMQITNILRDVKEDYDKNRVYIPVSLFVKYKFVDQASFFADEYNHQEKELILNELIELAISYYSESLKGLKHIPSFRARLCVKLMIAIYGAILGKIIFDKSTIFRKRVVISHFKKLIIFIKILLGFHPLKVANLINQKEML